MNQKRFRYDRVIVLVDMDCFYCQVEVKHNPELRGKPLAVVQYNEWKGGGIIAVNYEARAQGVTRYMRGDEAKAKCPEIELCKVPQKGGKADLTKYREAGKEVAAVLAEFTPLMERASVDEAYLDVTDIVNRKYDSWRVGLFQFDADHFENTCAVGFDQFTDFIDFVGSPKAEEHDEFSACFEPESKEEEYARTRSDVKLMLGAVVATEVRRLVLEKTGYECSAGVAHSKILAKFCAGINKPNKQTVLSRHSVPEMYRKVPVDKFRGLGGKLGETVCEKLGAKVMRDLFPHSERELQRLFDEKNGSWLYLIARGVDVEPVTQRFYSKSIGCCKRFPGKNAITTVESAQHWLTELAKELVERLKQDRTEHERTARQMVVSYAQATGSEDVSSSRTTSLPAYEVEPVVKEAFETIKRNTATFMRAGSAKFLNNPLKFLGLSAGKFEDHDDGGKVTIKEMFQRQEEKNAAIRDENPQPGTSKSCSDDVDVALPPATHFTPCPKCNELVDSDEIQCHLDAHLAMELSNQQREEFRRTIKVKTTPPAAPPAKKKAKSSPPVPTKSIASFFSQPMSPEKVEDDSEPRQACPKCEKMVKISEIPEHEDYHAALEVSEQINGVKRLGPVNELQQKQGAAKEEKKVGLQSVSKTNNLSKYFVTK